MFGAEFSDGRHIQGRRMEHGGGAVEGDIPKNLHELLCFKPLSDDTQDQKDGFGLMLPAAWQAV